MVVESAVLTKIAHFHESVVTFHNPTIWTWNLSGFPDIGGFDIKLAGRQFRRMSFHEIATGSARERDTRTIVERILSRMNWRVPIVIVTFSSALSSFERLSGIADFDVEGFGSSGFFGVEVTFRFASICWRRSLNVVGQFASSDTKMRR